MNPREHLARLKTAGAARERELEDQALEAAQRLGDQAPPLLREVAASIRDHREGAARRLADQETYRSHYQEAARQLAADDLADQWREMGIAAPIAAAWANAGYLPGEARHHIEQTTATTVAEMRAHTALGKLASQSTGDERTAESDQPKHRADGYDTGVCHE